MKSEDIIEEIKLIKYQLKLMKMMIDGDRYPYFMFITDHDISEEKEKLLRKIILFLKLRLDQKEEDDSDLYTEDKELLTSIFKKAGLSSDVLFSTQKPTFNEFSTYVKCFLGEDINVTYLLMSMEKQSMFIQLCDSLLKDMSHQ